MTDDEFLRMADEYQVDYGDAMAEDLAPVITPAFTALLHRECRGRSGEYTEVMWVQGFPSAKMVTVTHLPIVINGQRIAPGVVTSIPVGWRSMVSADAFISKCESIVATHQRHGGWARRPHTIQGS